VRALRAQPSLDERNAHSGHKEKHLSYSEPKCFGREAVRPCFAAPKAPINTRRPVYKALLPVYGIRTCSSEPICKSSSRRLQQASDSCRLQASLPVRLPSACPMDVDRTVGAKHCLGHERTWITVRSIGPQTTEGPCVLPSESVRKCELTRLALISNGVATLLIGASCRALVRTK
jgi:hypothetical protein